ncbi:MAG: pantetheine-phosphate adenylyltransferase [Clostridia bacterium]|nr:pantetheine-phosphate adenylyltransferase [Clostridia bacterium]
MKSCVFPGSFDPMTLGHLNLIERLSGMFDHVTVTVMVNIHKQGCIPHEERVRMLRKACAGIPNVSVELWHGLLSAYMKDHGETLLIRGVRDQSEFEKERTAAAINRRLYPQMETMLLPAEDVLTEVSSSAVREIAAFGGNYLQFVPDAISEDIRKWLDDPEKN